MNCLEALQKPRSETPPGLPLLLVAAAALIDKDGRVLIAQRPEGKPMAGLWEFPGGKIQDGETPEYALCRELYEELGIDAREGCFVPIAFASHSYEKFHLMINDFKGAFVCWATRQNPNETYGVIANATQAYTKFLQQRYFKTKDTVVEMDCDLIKKLTDEDLFVAIPEILALNEMKPDFIGLGALSRNVFYHILREQITQPL